MRRNLGLVGQVAFRFSRKLPNGVDIDDLKSEGVIGLSQAIEKFNPSKGFQFSTYAWHAIQRAIGRPAKLAAQVGHGGHVKTVSLFTPIGDSSSQKMLIGTLGNGKEQPLDCGEMPVGFDQLIKTLPEREQKILSMSYQKGMTDKAIATDLGMSKQRVHQIRHLCLKSLKKDLADGGER
jgi:RNA polymerase sigma factor (sigma-70 family)